MTQITCVQMAPVLLDLASNRMRTVDAISKAVGAGADVVVLPELVTSGYMFEMDDNLRSVAIKRDDGLFFDWAEAVGTNSIVIGGFCELGDDGLIYNSAAVVDASGVLAVYRKVHLWDREDGFFAAGSDKPPVIDTRHGQLGVLICYDLSFPEMARSLALRGADIIAVPTNWPLTPRPEGERAAEVTTAMSTARLNRLYVACCDRSGAERSQQWTEGSTIIDPEGWILADAQDGSATTKIETHKAEDKRRTTQADAFADRRPEMYDDLTRPDLMP